jgi:hypothetical protein
VDDVLGLDGVVDWPDLFRLLARFGLDLLFTSFIVVGVYYRLYRSREFVFTYFIFNIITFSLCVLLRKVPMELGFALGLFAVFGILRYRTEEIRMRDLTYLFIVIGVAILNAVVNKKVSLFEVIAVNCIIAGFTGGLELGKGTHGSTPMLYDNLELLRPDRRSDLLADLSARTGSDVIRVQVHRIDLLRDAAEITIFYQGRRN